MKTKESLVYILVIVIVLSTMAELCSCTHKNTGIESASERDSSIMIHDTYDVQSSELSVISSTKTYDPYDIPPSETSDDFPYSYTIGKNWAYPLVIVLPVEVESYVSVDGDAKAFDIHKLASDFRWKEQDGYFFFDAGELWVRMDFEHGVMQNSNSTGKDVFFGGKYRFVVANRPEVPFYAFNTAILKNTNDLEWHFYDPEEEPVDYVIDLDCVTYANWDELVLLTYLFTHVSVEARYSPFFYYPEYNVRHENEVKEIKELTQLERYTFG
ncbi:MAG: hypothetical protein J6T40_08380 [Clostridiales bacterium]|nr:hypothetical protein [Clostridiales bacterium]